MESREAMGLSASYQSSLVEDKKEMIENFRVKKKNELIRIIHSSNSFFLERWAAGIILGLAGDDRINPANPQMLPIPAVTTGLGSTLEEVDAVYHKYKHLGVKHDWLLKEFPKHDIALPAFRIAKYLITNYEYLIFLKETGYTGIPTSWTFGIYDASKSNHPVYGITPKSTECYVSWLNKTTKRDFRLPLEYEWEYAASGIERKEFPWGNEFSSDLANTLESGIYTTTPVGIYPGGASIFGCLDMAGNVEEYVSNNYFVYPNGQYIEDDLHQNGNYRIARGGSFTRFADLARCRRRHGYYNKDIYVIGFRLAESIN